MMTKTRNAVNHTGILTKLGNKNCFGAVPEENVQWTPKYFPLRRWTP